MRISKKKLGSKISDLAYENNRLVYQNKLLGERLRESLDLIKQLQELHNSSSAT